MTPDASPGRLAALAPDTARKAAGWYVALTLAATWPLATQLLTGVPSDLGDPLLNDWIMAWNARHALRVLGGDVAALREVWHANIFFPAPYVLGYSEVLATQSLLVLPVYALTGNMVLGYNLLFLTAFVLSGVGAFLLVRSLTGDWRAAFLGGVLFAFAPYRFHQAPHLQSIWSPWMPLVLYALDRWFVATERSGGATATGFARRHGVHLLLGAALALAAQNLSCGYYMLFFAPFVALFALWQMAARRRLGEPATWLALGLTGALSLAVTLPFMTPYFALRNLGQTPRGVEEVASFSADTFAYLTAHGGVHVWGALQVYPRPEGSLFPGLVPIALGLVGLAAALVACVRGRPAPAAPAHPVRRAAVVLAALAAGVYALVFVGLFFGLEGKHVLGPIEVRLFSVARPLLIALGAGGALMALSPAARAVARCALASPALFAAGAAFLAFWLSLGPIPRVLGDTLRDASLYGWLYDYVPGFSGLRVPARFAMIVVLFMSVLAAYGYRALAGARRTWLLPLVVAVFLVENAVVPLPMNGEAVALGHLNPPTTVPTRPTPLTRAIDALPREAILLELPFGDISWEIRYLYHSIFHWRRLVNGYSGDVPQRYVRVRDALHLLPEEGGDRAWQTIRQSGATHVVVHEAAYGPARAAAMRAWLEARGARLVAAADASWIYTLAGMA